MVRRRTAVIAAPHDGGAGACCLEVDARGAHPWSPRSDPSDATVYPGDCAFQRHSDADRLLADRYRRLTASRSSAFLTTSVGHEDPFHDRTGSSGSSMRCGYVLDLLPRGTCTGTLAYRIERSCSSRDWVTR